MSTRSYILIEENDGKFRGIYCHSDGYITFNGAMLVDHYNEKKKVEELIELGNISCLGERIKPNPLYQHGFSYDQRQQGVVVAYGRDRGETNQGAQIVTLQQLANDPWIEYTYVFTKDNKWKYFEGNSYKSYEDLIDVKEDLDKWFASRGIERPRGLYGFFDDDSIAIIKEEQENRKRARLRATEKEVQNQLSSK